MGGYPTLNWNISPAFTPETLRLQMDLALGGRADSRGLIGPHE